MVTPVNLTDLELSEAVARKLGWKPKNVMVGYGQLDAEVWVNDSPPPYATSIEAAFEIVDRMEWFCLARESVGKWAVWDMAGTEEATCICSADTPSRAICLAFLALGEK